MRRHAKASSAGSTEGSGSGRGLFRRALAPRGASSDSKGSGARSGGRLKSLFAVLALAICASALTAGSASAAPVITVGPITQVGGGSAHLTGTIDSNLQSLTWSFEYSTDGVKWSGFAFQGSVSGVTDEPEEVATDISGLKASTKYFVRLRTWDGQSAKQSSPPPYPSFTTLAIVPPTVTTAPSASEVEYSTATVTGAIQRPSGADTANDAFCTFEYVTDAQFTATGFANAGEAGCEPENPVGASAPVPTTVTGHLGGLKASTVYHLRLTAKNAGGSDSKEAASTFTTLAVTPPTVVSVGSKEVGYNEATAIGKIIRPAGSTPDFDAFCTFEYVTDAQFTANGYAEAHVAPFCGPENPVTSGEKEVSAVVCPSYECRLQAATTYHLRLTATNAGGSASKETTFTTLPLAKPVALAVSSSNYTNHGVDFEGSIQSEGGANPSFETFCTFEYITDAAFQARAEKQKLVVKASGGTFTLTFEEKTTAPLAFNASAGTVQAALQGLSTIGAGNVVVAGGPGSPSGTSPYNITFAGALAAKDVPEISADPSLLLPEEEGVTKVETVTSGHAEGFDGAQGAGCSQNPITAGGTTPVSAKGVGGLKANTTYHLRLSVSNGGGTDTKVGANFKTTSVITAQTINADAKADSATLVGRINAANAPVTYFFEWGSTASYGNVIPAVPASLPVVDEAPHAATAALSGLQPSTEYHFRLVATNTQTSEVVKGEDVTFKTTSGVNPPPSTCPNESSRVGFSAGLPDCRAIEFASPGLNEAGILEGGQASADGSGVIFTTKDAPLNAESSGVGQFIGAKRAPNGTWSTKAMLTSLSTPEPSFASTFIVAAAENQEEWLASSKVRPLNYVGDPADAPLNGEAATYFHRADGKWVSLKIHSGQNINPFTYVPPDFSHVFIEVEQPQLPNTVYRNTWEWTRSTEELKQLATKPGPGQVPFPEGGGMAGGNLGQFLAYSDNGSVVLFRAYGLEGPIFAKVNAEHTYEVTKSQRAVPDPVPQGTPLGAGVTPDGSKVLFLSRSELTEDANTGVKDAGADLYSFDIGTQKLTDLTVDNNPADAATGANVTGVVGSSHDASYIYFVATGNLAKGAVSGEPNLYVLHNGEIRFVTTGSGLARFYATPDGTHAALVSTESLTGYNNSNPSTGEPMGMVFKYTYGGGIECMSCRPDGGQPTSSASWGVNPENSRGLRARALSDDGSRAFFMTTDQLVPQASNGFRNTYEYTGGQVHLLSPGDTDSAVILLDVSASGDDVFVTSFQELVSGAGAGTAGNVYDIRANANVKGPTAPTPCTGENCRGGRTVAPQTPTPGTAGFEAAAKIVGPKSSSAKGPKLQLRVSVPSGGQLTFSGQGLKPGKKPVSKAGTVTITVTLKPGAEKKRVKKGVFKTVADVRFTPSSGDPSSASVSLKFEGAKKKGGK